MTEANVDKALDILAWMPLNITACYVLCRTMRGIGRALASAFS